jgi:IPT/TIG domain/Domain of unknown function (DUF5122) beta-propeller
MPRKLFRTLLTAALVSGSLVMLAPQSASALALTPDHTWSVGGKVYSLAHFGTMVYAGGTFKKVTSPAGQKIPVRNLAAFDRDTGVAIPGFTPTVENTAGQVKVSALALSSDGTTLYLGGQFDTVDGQPASNFAAVDATTGALDTSVSVSANKAVDVILTGPNLIYFGGAFNKVNGEDRGHLAALNLDGTLNGTWAPTTAAGNCPAPYYNSNTCSNGGNGTVRSLAMSSDNLTVFIGGEFYYVNGTADSSHWRNCIARVSAVDGSLDAWAVTPFNAITDDAQSHKPGPNMLWRILVTPTRVYGGFGRVPNYVQAFSLDTGNTGTSQWKIGTNGNDESLALSPDGTRLFVGGHLGTAVLDQQFSSCPGAWVHGLMSVSVATHAVLCDWLPTIKPYGGQNAPGSRQSPPNYVGGWAMFVDGNFLWVGGYFTSIAGAPQSGIARFTIVGSPPPPVPVITTFAPTKGPIGTVVTITGYGFTGATEVRFGAVDAVTYTVDNDTQISATVPDGSITAPLTLVAPGGTTDSGLKKFHVTVP